MYDSLPHRLNTERPKGCQNARSDSLQTGYFPIETKTVISVSLVDSQRWIWWKGRRSRVTLCFLFVCQLPSMFTVSNFLKNDTQEKSILLANDGRVKYHRSKWSPSLSSSSWLFILFVQDYWWEQRFIYLRVLSHPSV